MKPVTDTHPCDTLWRFEFDERVSVNSIVVRADHLSQAVSVVSLIFGESYVRNYTYSVHRID